MSCLVKRSLLLLFLIGSLAWTARAEIVRGGNEEGPAIVFLPGLASHGELWTPWVNEYQSSHRTYVLTAPGFAGEPATSETGSYLATLVAEVETALRADGVKDATVVGHSLGGLVALMLGADAPDLVGKLLIVDSVPYLGGLFMPGLAPEMVALQAGQMAQQMESMPRAAYDAQQRMGLRRLTLKTEFLPTLEAWSAASDQATIAVAFREILSTDYRAQLADIKAPAIILAAHNAMMPFGQEQLATTYSDQYGALKNADIRTVPDSSHFIMIDQPAAFSDALADTLKEGTNQ